MRKIFLGFVILFIIFGYMFYANQKIDFDKLVANSELKEKKFEKMPREIITSQNIKYWIIEDPQIDLISLSFSFNKAGTAYDTEDKLGLSLITAQMLDSGTKDYDYEKYHNILDLHGIVISFNADKDYFNGIMTTPSYNKEQAFDLLNKVLFEPRMDEDFLETLKKQFAVLVKTQKETPKSELSVKFKQEIFGTHPYGRTIETMADSVSQLQVNDVNVFLQNALVKDNLVISIAGNVTSDEASTLIDSIFNGFNKHNDVKQLEAPKLNLNPETKMIDRETAQVISMFALAGVKRLDKDFYPLYIANHIFGGSGLNSRLSIETREKEGLTYGVYTYLVTDDLSPLIMGSFSCVPENYDKMKKLLSDQMRKFSAHGVTKEELKSAKDYLLASYNLRFKSTLELSNMLNLMQKSKLGLDFLQKRNDYVTQVTLEEVNDVAKQYFQHTPKEVAIGLIK